MGIENKKIIKNVWKKAPDKFMNVEHTSQKNVLHPILSKMINNDNPKTLMDYGCGDGRILKYLNKKIDIDVFDINQGMLKLAKESLGQRVSNYFHDIKKIKSDNYDAILLGMVIICLKNEKEFDSLLRNVKRIIKDDGALYITFPHPCFRDRVFSNHKTSFNENQPFYYLSDGLSFDVLIKDNAKSSIAFTDFHWNLSTILNKLIKKGFVIDEFIETTDDLTHKNHNKYLSPFIIIKTK